MGLLCLILGICLLAKNPVFSRTFSSYIKDLYESLNRLNQHEGKRRSDVMSLICKQISASELILWFKAFYMRWKDTFLRLEPVISGTLCSHSGPCEVSGYKMLSNHLLQTRSPELCIAMVLCGLLYNNRRLLKCQWYHETGTAYIFKEKMDEYSFFFGIKWQLYVHLRICTY